MAFIDEILDREDAPITTRSRIGWCYTEEDEAKIAYAKKRAQEFMDNYGKGRQPDRFCKFLFTIYQ